VLLDGGKKKKLKIGPTSCAVLRARLELDPGEGPPPMQSGIAAAPRSLCAWHTGRSLRGAATSNRPGLSDNTLGFSVSSARRALRLFRSARNLVPPAPPIPKFVRQHPAPLRRVCNGGRNGSIFPLRLPAAARASVVRPYFASPTPCLFLCRSRAAVFPRASVDRRKPAWPGALR